MEIWDRVEEVRCARIRGETGELRKTRSPDVLTAGAHEEDRFRDPLRHPGVGGRAERQPRLSAAERSAEGSLRLCYHAEAREPFPETLLAKLLDIGQGRIAAMDSFGIDVAVLSLVAPGVEQFDPALGTKLARQRQ